MSLLTSRAFPFCAASTLLFAFGCAADPGDAPNEVAVEQGSHGGTEIHSEDRCDPVTFGALCNPNFHGTTTLDQFNTELDATQRVAAWEYGGGQGRIRLGQSLQVDNKGGETHTFTVVANFGGGRVPPLNDRSGNTVVAPECVAGANATNVDIKSGAGISVTTGASGAIKTRGTFKVQCCIHPWMRTTVTVQ
jgi:plastocyanin